MANPEHLEILTQGSKAWNEWRAENPKVRPELWSADLRDADLRDTDLQNANLEAAKLQRANLRRADLTNADLRRADLQAANLQAAGLRHSKLQRASLRGANLQGTYLEAADLRDAYLEDADLREANLQGANLSCAHLQGAYLWDADLQSADLQSAHLQSADLQRADLQRADLQRADLEKAHLQGAHLRGAHLREAHLREAYLEDADLRDANLQGANLQGANLLSADLGWTVFANVDMSETKHLEQVTHHGPSPVSTSALTKSKGKIPEAFLRGCGLQDWEIEAAKLWNPHLSRDQRTEIAYEVVNLQAESPIVLHSVFISYSSRDSAFVEELEAGLDQKRIRYWRDVHEMKAGRLETQIDKAIRMNPIVLLVLSENSVESDWVEWEVRKARELAKVERRDVLCPIALDDSWERCDWPERLRVQIEEFNILDFSDPATFDGQFEKLVDGIVEFYPGQRAG